MNIILLEEHELGHNLSRRDERTVHLLKVLHKKAGDTFEAGILGGMRGTGKIEKINFDGSIFISIQADEPPPPRMRLRMAVAFVRPIQIRRIFRDLSGMGVSAIDLIGTDLGERSYRDTKLLGDGGAHAALVEGAVQARDTQLPVFSVFENLDNWLDERPWEKTGSMRIPLLHAMDNVRAEGSLFYISPTSRPWVIAIGPERGWSDRERELFEKAGFMRLSMGSRPLRTETACIAAAALAMEKIME
ncbi:MAG: RsmE family RNA methyltransferase [Spirochaetes bacterium]|nr:RsmE family RNA methyltransferase [Brevinematales bacterium]MCL1958254.1 RsmE family RNA methyltransferase [Spirochaetota bacterium]